MEDIANIGFKAETSDLLTASQRLNALDPAAKKAETASQRFQRRMQQMGGIVQGVFGRLVTATRNWADNSQRTFDRISGVVGRGFNTMINAAKGWIAAAAVAFSFTNIVSTLADFEHTMSAVAAVSGATGVELQSLRDTAIELGSTTMYSASQAASGLQMLTMASYTSEEAILTLPSVLNLAATESLELGDATGYVTGIMAGFGLGVADAVRTTDTLVFASNAANTGVADLAEGMKFVAPVARALGISIEETAAAMGILSNAGLRGSQAGTALRGVLASLSAPSNVARDAMGSLGLTAAEISPQTHSLQEIVDTLAASGLDAATAFRIFGAEGAPAILALTANNGALAELNAGLATSGGTAERIAGIMSNDLKGSIDNASSAVEGLIIAIGDAGLTAALRFMFDTATTVFSFLSTNMDTLRGYVIAAALAFTIYMAPAILASAVAVGTFVAALITLRGALITTGIGALIVLGGLLINKILEIVEATGGWGEAMVAMGKLASATWNGIVTMAGAIPAGLAVLWNQIRVAFYGMVADLQLKWLMFVSSLNQSAVAMGLDGLAGTLAGVHESIGQSLDETTVGIDALNTEIETGTLVAQTRAVLGWTAVQQAWQGLQNTVTNTTETITENNTVLDENTGAVNENAAALGGGAAAASNQQTALQALGEEYGRLLDPINQAQTAFKNAQEAFDLGVLDQDQYTTALSRIQDAFLATGGSAQQWATIMNGATDSVAKRLEDLGENSISRVGDELFELAWTGKANFADLTKSIIKDLWKMAYEALIVKPLMAWLGFADGGTFGTPAAAPVSQPFAKGGAFTNTVVNRPTPFRFATGGGFALGEMGEAGPEAVMPLTRGPDGSLGVQMYAAASRSPEAAAAHTATGQGGALTIHVTAEEGDMFRPVIRTEAQGVAIKVVQQAAPAIVKDSVSAAQKSKRKSNAAWGD